MSTDASIPLQSCSNKFISRVLCLQPIFDCRGIAATGPLFSTGFRLSRNCSNQSGRINLANRFPVVGTFVWNRYTVTAPVFRYPGRLFVGVWNGQVSTGFYTPPALQQQIYKPDHLLLITSFRSSRNRRLILLSAAFTSFVTIIPHHLPSCRS